MELSDIIDSVLQWSKFLNFKHYAFALFLFFQFH